MFGPCPAAGCRDSAGFTLPMSVCISTVRTEPCRILNSAPLTRGHADKLAVHTLTAWAHCDGQSERQKVLTQLGERADAGDGLADQGGRKAELRHAADEELVLLREAEALDAEELRASQAVMRGSFISPASDTPFCTRNVWETATLPTVRHGYSSTHSDPAQSQPLVIARDIACQTHAVQVRRPRTCAGVVHDASPGSLPPEGRSLQRKTVYFWGGFSCMAWVARTFFGLASEMLGSCSAPLGRAISSSSSGTNLPLAGRKAATCEQRGRSASAHGSTAGSRWIRRRCRCPGTVHRQWLRGRM